MSEQLKGGVALITCAASGIGQTCAVPFAEEGASNVAADLADCSETEIGSPTYEWAMSYTPAKRLGTAREQANAALFLAGDRSSYYTGQF